MAESLSTLPAYMLLTCATLDQLAVVMDALGLFLFPRVALSALKLATVSTVTSINQHSYSYSAL